MTQRTGRLYRLQSFGVVTPQATPSAGRPVSFCPHGAVGSSTAPMSYSGRFLEDRMTSSARRPALPIAALLSLLALVTASAPTSAVPIRDLHAVTTSGVPAPPYGPGVTVTVTGVVVSPDNTFSLTSDEVVVRDTTGAITVFRSGRRLHLQPGRQRHGHRADRPVQRPDRDHERLDRHHRTRPATSPTTTTRSSSPASRCATRRSNYTTIREDRESQLIRINNVTVVGGTWPTTCTGSTRRSRSRTPAATTIAVPRQGHAALRLVESQRRVRRHRHPDPVRHRRPVLRRLPDQAALPLRHHPAHARVRTSSACRRRRRRTRPARPSPGTPTSPRPASWSTA